MSAAAEKRRDGIMLFMLKKREATCYELACEFSCSVYTIYRDVAVLADRHRLDLDQMRGRCATVRLEDRFYPYKSGFDADEILAIRHAIALTSDARDRKVLGDLLMRFT